MSRCQAGSRAKDVSYLLMGPSCIAPMCLAVSKRGTRTRKYNGAKMLEKLPEAIGESLTSRRAGIEDAVFFRLGRPEIPRIELKSVAFKPGGSIPSRFTADGIGYSPQLSWRGVPPVNLATPVRYFRPEEGGVSHFNYLRDNLLLSWMHTRLFAGFLLRLPALVWRRLAGSAR